MLAYTTAAITAIVVLSLVLMLITRKRNLVNMRLLMLTGLGSAVVSCSFAWIYTIFLGLNLNNAGYLNSIPALLISFVLIVILLLVITVTVSTISCEKQINAYIETGEGIGKGEEDTAGADKQGEEVNYDNQYLGTGQPAYEFNTIGLENYEYTAEDYVNEAFAKKGSGDFEGAVQACITALEKKPGYDLAFSIVLDICAMYKDLGKKELAAYILESYALSYTHLMEEDIRLKMEEILS
jgi:hypothetical protein